MHAADALVERARAGGGNSCHRVSQHSLGSMEVLCTSKCERVSNKSTCNPILKFASAAIAICVRPCSSPFYWTVT